MSDKTRLIAAADLLDTRQVSMRPDLDKALAAWLRAVADEIEIGVEYTAAYPLTWQSAEAFADLLLEKP